MPFPNWQGRTRIWTRERVDVALQAAVNELKGALPSSDRAWNELKRGRYDWPPAARILEYYHSMAKAWQAAGASPERIKLSFSKWTEEENAYLLEHAGMYTLKAIARHLGRSYPATRARLNKWYSIQSRHNQGYLSAAELAREYNCSCHRIRLALAEGKIKGRYDRLRNRWRIDLNDLTPEAKEILTRPKRTHKTGPTDKGDYYIRYGLRRRVIDGRVKVFAAT